MEPNVLHIKQRTLNKAWILFDNAEKAKKWDKILNDLNVSNIKLIYHQGDKLYFGFKMFRCKHQMASLIVKSNTEIYDGYGSQNRSYS